MEKTRLVVVAGPTATGKTALAVAMAQRLGGEIVSADSMQIYRGLDIGTAKPGEDERGGVPHHLIDVTDIGAQFSAADYVDMAGAAVADIAARDRLPIVAGGTGLYIRSLASGVAFSPAPRDDELRASLERRYDKYGGDALHAELAAVDPRAAGKISPGDKKRVVRALEIYTATGAPQSEWDERSRAQGSRYDALMIGLRCADRAQLYRRIDERVDLMMERGLLLEARGLYDERERCGTCAQAIGYKELFAFFEGRVPLERAVEDIKRATRRYAKRQLTWFARDDMTWLDVDTMERGALVETACDLVAKRFAL